MFQDQTRATRKQTRAHVRWQANCRVGGWDLEGEVLDASPGGMFFASPEGGGFVRQVAREGELVSVTLRRGSTLQGTVRWVGRSARHGRVGMGVQFGADQASSQLAQLWHYRDALTLLTLDLLAANRQCPLVSNAERALSDGIGRISDAISLTRAQSQLGALDQPPDPVQPLPATPVFSDSN